MTTRPHTIDLLIDDTAELRRRADQLGRELLVLAAGQLALCLIVALLAWRILWAAH